MIDAPSNWNEVEGHELPNDIDKIEITMYGISFKDFIKPVEEEELFSHDPDDPNKWLREIKERRAEMEKKKES